MNSLVNALTFKGQEVRTVVDDRTGEILWIAADVCRVLELGNPTQALSRLDADETTLISNEGRTPTGGIVVQNVNAVNESGLFSLILSSRKPEAKEFKRWVTHEVLPSIRKTGSYLSPSQRADKLELENAAMRLKLELFEEYHEEILYDFDQMAAAIGTYHKPPFGRNHLKDWLVKHGILCKQHCKNDKPIQKYIDDKWFFPLIHEWKRNRNRQYEFRYLITQRGFNKLVDLAIQERLITLPAPAHQCLPFEPVYRTETDIAAVVQRDYAIADYGQ